MMLNKYYRNSHAHGFSLVELMVGLVIGLIATLVISQTFSVFEGQKRTTTGVSDTQTNGTIALYNVMRDAQMAGFGLPFLDRTNPPMTCSPAPTIDHDNNAATPAIDLFPVVITDGGAAAGASDQVALRYSFTYTQPALADRRKVLIGGIQTDFPSNPGVSVEVINPLNATTTGVTVHNNRGCQNGDIVLASKFDKTSGINACALLKVTATNAVLDADTTKLKLNAVIPVLPHSYINGSLSCLGRWNEITYRVNGNKELERGGQPYADNDPTLANRGLPNAAFVPNVAGVVNVQAQYGVSTNAQDNQISNWVDATGAWLNPAFADKVRIKAIRVAIVARSGLLEKENVTGACTTAQGTVNNGPCAWDDAGLDPAPKIDLSDDANWRRYRYRVYETIIPIRNIAWARGNL